MMIVCPSMGHLSRAADQIHNSLRLFLLHLSFCRSCRTAETSPEAFYSDYYLSWLSSRVHVSLGLSLFPWCQDIQDTTEAWFVQSYTTPAA